MQGKPIMKNSVKILLCIFLLLVLVQAVQAAETYQFVTKWGSSGSGDGQFISPVGVAVDSSGNVFVVDDFNQRIQKFSATGTFLAKWGTNGSGDGQFYNPRHITVDSLGNVYVADTGNNRIQKLSTTGTFLTKWGTLGSDDGQFLSPVGVAVDSLGNVYVADLRNNRIQKFSATGTFLTKWGIEGPQGVAVDSLGNIYVSSGYWAAVKKFSSIGTLLANLASGGLVYGQSPDPRGVAVDSSGNVYVADYNNNRIEKFNSTGTFLTKWGSYGFSDGQFSYPAGVAADSSGNVYIADTGNYRIQKFATATTATTTIPTIVPTTILTTQPTVLTVTPTLPPLSVTTISATTGTNDQSISANVTGTGFKPGAVVRLTLTGQPDIIASGVTLIGDSLITCSFDLTGKATGTWDLAVTNPVDGTTSVRSTAFTLTTRHIPDYINGTIIVSSTPQDALVYLDGTLKGTGSFTLVDISPGEHSVRVTKTMFNDYGTDVRVVSGSTNYVNAVLTPVSGPIISGTILASSNPAGANVLLDGMDKGISPVTITGVSSGSHTVSFTKTGYTPASRTATIAAGQTMEISVELTKTGGWDWGDWLNTTTLIIIGIIVLILVIMGVLIRKKKNRWDKY